MRGPQARTTVNRGRCPGQEIPLHKVTNNGAVVAWGKAAGFMGQWGRVCCGDPEGCKSISDAFGPSGQHQIHSSSMITRVTRTRYLELGSMGLHLVQPSNRPGRMVRTQCKRVGDPPVTAIIVSFLPGSAKSGCDQR